MTDTKRIFVVSRGYFVTETTRVEAADSESALTVAKTSPDSHWKATDSDSVNYQVEYEETASN